MQILDYNHRIETQLCHDVMWGGEGGIGGIRRHNPAKAKTEGKVTTIKEGFNDHAVVLPNGCTITINESGEVYLQEDGGAQKKLRNRDALQKCLIT
jgi:hypothetical protein|tara:strand:+ start:23519 stop:23806 length:288 start_codon:yes stop_codon:yes gene_type:complete